MHIYFYTREIIKSIEIFLFQVSLLRSSRDEVQEGIIQESRHLIKKNVSRNIYFYVRNAYEGWIVQFHGAQPR